MGDVLAFQPSPRITVATIVMKDRANVLLGRSNRSLTSGKLVIPGSYLQLYETIFEASARGIKEQAGITVNPKQMLFMSEKVDKDTKEHRLAAFCFGEYVEGEPKPGSDFTDITWVDPRELGNMQSELDELTVDAFYKFSIVMRSQANGVAAQ
jgi:ADP-ribose pyrophosphatase YjhB (NUDIX family)